VPPESGAIPHPGEPVDGRVSQHCNDTGHRHIRRIATHVRANGIDQPNAHGFGNGPTPGQSRCSKCSDATGCLSCKLGDPGRARCERKRHSSLDVIDRYSFGKWRALEPDIIRLSGRTEHFDRRSRNRSKQVRKSERRSSHVDHGCAMIDDSSFELH
jgi:hypothetical protein